MCSSDLARLVRRRRAGREHLLSLEQAPLDEAAAWMASQRDIWNTRLDALEALLEAEEAGTGDDEGQNPVHERGGGIAGSENRR